MTSPIGECHGISVNNGAYAIFSNNRWYEVAITSMPLGNFADRNNRRVTTIRKQAVFSQTIRTSIIIDFTGQHNRRRYNP